ncbi:MULTISPECIES: acylneuraminate cytidylyltransferase family protein [Brachybacterium]|uniref:acylneuraminate cytidylyltransferase family protein n=1 Tax=Brachybacterium TaxID=43668 RepID=UPI0015F0A0A7|nr:acylneuraminate cytidylyltransferase family protein [Brachybacterium alimentarium]
MTTVFLPARAGSERVKDKNTRPFASFPGGLLELKLRQLDRVPGIDEVLVSTNDDEVARISAELGDELEVPVVPLARPDRYGCSSSSMQTFIQDYIASLDLSGTVLWTHVTHPLMTSDGYRRVLRRYDEVSASGCDSLVTTTKVQEFLWKNGKPFNYDPVPERWPRTQDLAPLRLINHAAYVIDFSTLVSIGDRVGLRPDLFDITTTEAFDIDWQEDFDLAEEIVSFRRGVTATERTARPVL